MKRNTSVCPITNTLNIFGDKWSLIIVRDCFAGKHTFNQFRNSPEGIASNILSARLSHLENQGIIKSITSNETSRRKHYRLTSSGLALYPILDAISEWGLKHISGTEKRIEVPKA